MKFSKAKYLYIFHVVISIFILFVGCSFGEHLLYEDVEPIISILQNTSVMVFTIMGIWIAYLYPNAILRITQPSKIEAIFSIEDEKRVKLIVGTVVISALVMAALILCVTAKPILAHSILYAKFSASIRCLGLIILLSLSYIQLLAIYIVVASNVNFIIDLKNKRNLNDLNRKL